MPGPGLDLIGDEELAQLADVIRSGRLSRYGPDDASFPAKVRHLEEAIAERAGVRHALAVNSGTSALFLALAGLGVGPGDEVIVPGFTYVATISSVVYARGRPVLAEVDDTLNLDPVDVEARITPRTRAIVAVHMLGNPARIEQLRAVADRHGLSLIEDAAQAFGATYDGRWLGSFGSAGIFSFNEYKTITCGDGGMLVTDDEDLYRRCFALHDQGHSPQRRGVEVGARPMLGLNFRMTELEGAVLLAQLGKLERIRSHLRANRDLVWSLLTDLPGIGFRALPDRDGDLATHLVVVLPGCRQRPRRHRGARLDHARPVGLARLRAHGAPAGAAHRDRPRLPLRLQLHARGRRPLRTGHAAGDRCAAGANDELRHRRGRSQPGPLRAAHARRCRRGAPPGRAVPRGLPRASRVRTVMAAPARVGRRCKGALTMLGVLAAGATLAGCVSITRVGDATPVPAGDSPVPLTAAATSPAAATASARPDRPLRIGYISLDDSNAFLRSVDLGVRTAAASVGVDLMECTSGWTREGVLACAERFGDIGIDGLVSFQPHADLATQVCAATGDVPTVGVVFDQGPCQVSQLRIDQAESGRLAGAAVGRFAAERWGCDVSAYLSLESSDADPDGRARMAGYRAGFEEHCPLPAQTIVLDGADRLATAQTGVSGLLGDIPGRRIVVVGLNEDAIQGAMAAAREAGRERQLWYSGQLADPAIREHIACDGHYIASVAQSPESFGPTLIPLLLDAIEGAEVPGSVDAALELVTAANVRELFPDTPACVE